MVRGFSAFYPKGFVLLIDYEDGVIRFPEIFEIAFVVSYDTGHSFVSRDIPSAVTERMNGRLFISLGFGYKRHTIPCANRYNNNRISHGRRQPVHFCSCAAGTRRSPEPQNFRAGILVRIDGSCTGRGWERLRESVDEMPAWGIL
jgi:hypothetical protein